MVTSVIGFMGLIYNCFNRNIYSVVNSDHVELYQTLTVLNKTVSQKFLCRIESRAERVLSVLTDFVNQINAHHQREEGLMGRYHYPLVREHSNEHIMLLRILENLCAQVRAEQITLTTADVAQIKDRLTGHINNSDSHLETYLAGCEDLRSARRKDLSQPSQNPLFYLRAMYNGVPAGVVMANRAKRASLDAARKHQSRMKPPPIQADKGRKAMDAIWYK